MPNVRESLNPKLDLMMDRVVDLPVQKVWQAWTNPDLLRQWFCPKPWRVTECEMDVRPGGLFRTVMGGPEGETHAGSGCYLELVENERIVWTDALTAGYRPNNAGNDCIDGHFTAYLLMEPEGKGTRYTAIVKHATEAACKQHKEIGFEEGWGKALEQLVELMKPAK